MIGNRAARLKALTNTLSEKEIKEILLPRVASSVSPYDFLINKSTTMSYRKPTFSSVHFNSLYHNLQQQIEQHHPQIATRVTSPSCTQAPNLTTFIDDRNKPSNPSLQDKSSLASQMKEVFNSKYDDFVAFSVATVSNFDISQNAYQNVLRNSIGKDLADIIGVNVFVPKNDMTQKLNHIKSSLKDKYNLKYSTYNNTMAAFINIRNAIEHVLSKENMQKAVQTPNDALLIYYYCDAFPWMSWSRYFTGETSIRIKLVEPYNMLSTAITVCSFLGPDNYELISHLCQDTFEQLATLDHVTHPILGRNIKVYVRGLGDGANRRTITGSSTAKSTFPIEEAPEHQSQLGDMTVYCPEPLRTVEETKQASALYKEWLGNKKDTSDNRREFAKTNCGLTGRPSICGTEMADFYPGTMHRCINSTQTICHRIHQVALLTQADKGKGWEKEVSKIARNIKDGFQVKLSHAGVYAFCEIGEQLLVNAGFSGLIGDILTTFCSGLKNVFPLLMDTPQGLTGKEFERNARIYLGFQFPIIFGYQSLTATLKQVTVYSAFYIDKAISDARIVGLPVTLQNLTDSIMETKHKECKQGNYIFSGGRAGETGRKDYQERVLEQQFVNEWLRLENRENVQSTSSDRKVEQKSSQTNNNKKKSVSTHVTKINIKKNN